MTRRRFDAKWVLDTKTGCHLWRGAITAKGYGAFWLDGGTRKAHRIAYEIAHGSVPRGMEIDHLCRVRHCVNPAHLEAVTPWENWRRGLAPSAQSAHATHCKWGHYFETDGRLNAQGERVCVPCSLRRAREQRARRHTPHMSASS